MSLFSFITNINGYAEIPIPPFILTPLPRLLNLTKISTLLPFILTPPFIKHLRVEPQQAKEVQTTLPHSDLIFKDTGHLTVCLTSLIN